MPNIECPVAITCEGTDDPIINYSSEAVDAASFTAVAWPITDGGPIGPDPVNPNTPIFPTTYRAEGCISTCISVTQELANFCAQSQAFVCANTPPSDQPQPTFFYNRAQSCSVQCPDGTAFTWTVAAGYFTALTQAQADAKAMQYACNAAHTNRICLSDISDFACESSTYSDMIVANTGFPSVTMSISAGSLPPGLTFVQAGKTATISGTPTTPGDYTFTVKATNGNATKTKNYAISVLGISNSPSLGGGTVCSAYSVQLNGAGGNPGYVFDLDSGSLPYGLTMNVNGLISGTCKAEGLYSFGVRITDADGAGDSCVKSFAILVVQDGTGYPRSIHDMNAWTQTIVLVGGGSSYTASVVDGVATVTVNLPIGWNIGTWRITWKNTLCRCAAHADYPINWTLALSYSQELGGPAVRENIFAQVCDTTIRAASGTTAGFSLSGVYAGAIPTSDTPNMLLDVQFNAGGALTKAFTGVITMTLTPDVPP